MMKIFFLLIFLSISVFCFGQKEIDNDTNIIKDPSKDSIILKGTRQEWEYWVALMRTSSKMKASDVDDFLLYINSRFRPDIPPKQDSIKVKSKNK